MIKHLGWLIIVVMLFSHAFAIAQTSNVDQNRFEVLTSQLRCLVCQNEDLNDSTAPLAMDLKKQIRAMMAQGQSNEQIIHYLTARYGEFVLFKPSFSPKNYLLWIGPILLLLIALFILAKILYQKKHHQILTLTSEERAKLERLLK